MTLYYAEPPGPSWVQIAVVCLVIAAFIGFCVWDFGKKYFAKKEDVCKKPK